MRNIELKARLRDVESASRICAAVGATYQHNIAQTDTYFHVPSGRLKLRENDPGNTELIYYHRADTASSKSSDYEIAPGSAALREMLASALGVIVAVRKVRALWLWENVRIHLDHVDELGTFIEFEAVLGPEYDDADGHAKISTLSDAFGVNDEDRIAQSYVDLLGVR